MEAAPTRLHGPDLESEGVARRPLGPVLSFMRSLWFVDHSLELASRRMKERIGVTGPERMVIRLVGRYPGISAGELARILHVHPSSMTGVLKRAVRRELVSRRSDPSDARRSVFMLTTKGEAVDKLKRGTIEAAVRTALEALPERDVQAAALVLDALGRAIER